MNRYLVKSTDKASKIREEYFVELGLNDFWTLAMKLIGISKIPPGIIIDDIENAYNVLSIFIAECGNTIIVDLPDGYNTDNLTGIETENETMRLIWYSVDKAYQTITGEKLNDGLIELNQYVFGKNLEQQYGFTFDKLLVTPSYILIYAKNRVVPAEIENDKELLKNQQHQKLIIYEHSWGSFEQKPILQYRTRYYCNEGLVAVLSPKACGNAFSPDDFFEV